MTDKELKMLASATPQQRAFLLRTMSQPSQQFQGFDQSQMGKLMANEESREAGAALASLASEQAALQQMQMGRPRQIPHGGAKSWLEAASEGFSAGMGMYDKMRAQKAKADAVRQLGLLSQSENEPMSSRMGSMPNPDDLANDAPTYTEMESMGIEVPKAPLAIATPVTPPQPLSSPQSLSSRSGSTPNPQLLASPQPLSSRSGSIPNPQNLRSASNPMTPGMKNENISSMLRNGAVLDPYTGQVFYR